MNKLNESRKLVGRTAALVFALTAGAALSATAGAATPDASVPSAVVRYGDLNLSTEQGAKTLYRRIAMIAKQVCPNGESRGAENFARAQTCQREAIERAVNAVHNEHLAAVFAASHRQG